MKHTIPTSAWLMIMRAGFISCVGLGIMYVTILTFIGIFRLFI